MPVDLADAVLQQLRLSPTAAAFGDTYTPGPPPSGVMKFFGDFAAEVAEPYLVIGEPSEDRQYFSPGVANLKPFIANGTLPISVFAATRDSARSLADLASRSLNDIPLMWTGVTNMMLMRNSNAFFVPIPAIGPGVPTTFNRVIIMSYAYQGAL